jgi:hypothetical protein
MDMIMDNMKKNKENNTGKQTCEFLCKIHDTDLGVFLVCLDENPEKCKFSLSYGYRYLCKWQLIYTSLVTEDSGIQKRQL